MDPNTGLTFWLTNWNWQPSIILGTIAIICLYLYAVGPLARRWNQQVQGYQMFCFLAGVICMFLSLFSALDELGDTYLFSAHMIQHMILTTIGPPLMLTGIPGWLFEPVFRNRLLLRVGRVLTNPFVAFALFNGNFWFWHAPPLYDATLSNLNLHILEHLLFIGTGFIYWWPVFSPSRELPALSVGGKILYLFLGGMPTVALGAGLTFAAPIYTPYINAPRIWGISAATDQQLGGLIMWIPGSLLTIVIVSIIFIRWMQMQEQKQRAAEALQYGDVVEDENNEEWEEDESEEVQLHKGIL
jgi:cytochrome c oxidase assembly factor CtaG